MFEMKLTVYDVGHDPSLGQDLLAEHLGERGTEEHTWIQGKVPIQAVWARQSV